MNLFIIFIIFAEAKRLRNALTFFREQDWLIQVLLSCRNFLSLCFPFPHFWTMRGGSWLRFRFWGSKSFVCIFCIMEVYSLFHLQFILCANIQLLFAAYFLLFLARCRSKCFLSPCSFFPCSRPPPYPNTIVNLSNWKRKFALECV